MSPLISVIIPVYNTEKYLNRCLNSILNNSYKELEILCINDGSTDESSKVLRDYENNDSRIIVYDVPHGGVSYARNIGLEKAQGEYICFIDSDDWVHNDFFFALVNSAEKNNAEIAVCNLKRISDVLNDEVYSEKGLNTTIFESTNGLNNHTVKSYIGGHIYSRRVIHNHRFVNEVKISEDTLFNIEIISNNEDIKIVLLDTELYYYFDRPESAINTSSGLDFKVLSYIYLERAENADSVYATGVYLDDAFKNTFATRYLTMFIKDNNLRNEIKELINRCLSLEKKNKPLSKQKAIIYRLFSYFPFLYRWYRIMGDHTLLEWERNQKSLK